MAKDFPEKFLIILVTRQITGSNFFNMRINYLYLLLLFLACSCSSFKHSLIQTGSLQGAVQNAILDFSNTSKLYKNDSVFSVSIFNPLYESVLEDTDDGNGQWVEGKPYTGIIAINITANYNKILLSDSIKVGEKGNKIPTRYFENDGKLFYWFDDNCVLTHKTLTVFKRYNLLVENNLDGMIAFYNFEIDDSKKGVDYYFCENDLSQYKKTTTNKGIGFYSPPKLNCDAN